MRRFIECLVPTTACNLRCSYCYVIQEGRRKNEKAVFKYSPERIGKGLSKERLGGISFISLTASGETFIVNELPYIALEILKQGHFINITTNGTLTKQIDSFLFITKGYHDHIHLSFSLHYVELKKRNLLDVFFSNIRMVRNAGCSILLQINLVDEYLPYWDEIKKISITETGALPQVALTRDESNGEYKIMSSLMDKEDYFKKGNEMDSPLFKYTFDNFMIKRKEYCYAGFWSGKLNLGTGELRGCYGMGFHQDIFENINKPIRFHPIGKHCSLRYCINSSHFISQGIIPELLPQPSYGELRNREEARWYNDTMKDFLYKQFKDENIELNQFQMIYFEYKNKIPHLIYLFKRFLYGFIKK